MRATLFLAIAVLSSPCAYAQTDCGELKPVLGAKANSDDPMPVVVARGMSAPYPEHMRIVRATAACVSMFDLDDAGVPLDVETRCNLSQVDMSREDAASVARMTGFAQKAGTLSIQCLRFGAVGSDLGGKWRTNLMFGIDFALGQTSGVEKPSAFNRDGRPPMTQEQIDHYAKRMNSSPPPAPAPTSSKP